MLSNRTAKNLVILRGRHTIVDCTFGNSIQDDDRRKFFECGTE